MQHVKIPILHAFNSVIILQLLGDFVPPDLLPGLCPWTPLGDQVPQTPILPPILK